MMKKSVGILIVSIVALFFLGSCNKEQHDNACVSFTTAQVTKVAGPDTISVNQEADLTVSFYLSDGCGKFIGLEETTAGNSTVISLKSKYEGCVCPTVILNGQINYKFKAGEAGVYYLKILQPNKTYFTDTIIVN